jgi:hypothetical protein
VLAHEKGETRILLDERYSLSSWRVVSVVSQLFSPPPGLGYRDRFFGNGPAPDATVARRVLESLRSKVSQMVRFNA